MGRSFRLRIIVLSVSVSGVVLAVFALAAWAFVHRIGLRQIDREMAKRVGPTLVVSHPREHWSWIADGLNLSYGPEGCVVLVKGPDGDVLHRSRDWPSELPADGFPAPDPSDPRLVRFPPPPAPPAPPRASSDSRPALEESPAAPPQWAFLPVTPPEFATRRTREGTWRLCTMQNTEVTLVVGVSLEAFGGGLGFFAVGFVFLAGQALGQAAPTPGGIGAVEAAMIAAMTTLGLDAATAVPTVFLYRIGTFWLPVLPGFLSLRRLQRDEYI